MGHFDGTPAGTAADRVRRLMEDHPSATGGMVEFSDLRVLVSQADALRHRDPLAAHTIEWAVQA